jgi:chemotaxis-related protein WspD
MTERADTPAVLDVRIDDCWNRIGTRGDQSCPALAEWTRCLNCPVFERAAARLLDRPLADAVAVVDAGTPHTVVPASDSTQSSETQSAVVFRVADEWLALPTAALRQIEDLRPIHSLPHRRNRVVLGLVNVRGALTVAVSLAELLRLERTAANAGASPAHGAQVAARHGSYARMLVAAHQCEPVVFPVDEVHGVVRYAAGALKPVPDTLTRSSAVHAAGVLAWRDRTVGVLDAARVFASLTQSLQ